MVLSDCGTGIVDVLLPYGQNTWPVPQKGRLVKGP